MWTGQRATWEAQQGFGRFRRVLTEPSEPGEAREVANTVFTLLAEEDCQILSVLAASLCGSEISSIIKWVLMFGGDDRERSLWRENIHPCENPVGQWQQGEHLAHQLGGLLVSGQGKEPEFMIPLERVEGV